MKTGAIIVILLLGFGIIFSLVMTNVGNHAIDAWAEYATRPDTAVDIIMQSRQTAAATPTRTGAAWLGAGLLAFSLVIMGAVVLFMQNGAEFLKQWRLVKKGSGGRQRWQPVPPVPHSPPLQLQDVSKVPTARPLPDGGYYEANHNNHHLG